MEEFKENEFDNEGNYKFSKEYFNKQYNQSFETASLKSEELETTLLNNMNQFQTPKPVDDMIIRDSNGKSIGIKGTSGHKDPAGIRVEDNDDFYKRLLNTNPDNMLIDGQTEEYWDEYKLKELKKMKDIDEQTREVLNNHFNAAQAKKYSDLTSSNPDYIFKQLEDIYEKINNQIFNIKPTKYYIYYSNVNINVMCILLERGFKIGSDAFNGAGIKISWE